MYYIEELFLQVEWLSLSMILKKFLNFPKSEPRDSYKKKVCINCMKRNITNKLVVIKD